MKKKTLAILLAAVLTFAMPVASMAAETESTESGQEITVVLTATPEYTITIPESVQMGNDGTTVNVVASDFKNIPEEGRVVVTVAGTNYYRNQMVLTADTQPKTVLRYQIINEAGETIESDGSSSQPNVGKEVVSFTEEGTKQYQIIPVIAGNYEYDVAYTGSITFGISLQ